MFANLYPLNPCMYLHPSISPPLPPPFLEKLSKKKRSSPPDGYLPDTKRQKTQPTSNGSDSSSSESSDTNQSNYIGEDKSYTAYCTTTGCPYHSHFLHHALLMKWRHIPKEPSSFRGGAVGLNMHAPAAKLTRQLDPETKNCELETTMKTQERPLKRYRKSGGLNLDQILNRKEGQH